MVMNGNDDDDDDALHRLQWQLQPNIVEWHAVDENSKVWNVAIN